MKTSKPSISLIIFVISLMVTVSPGLAGETPAALKGVNKIEAIFDIRAATPKTAKIYLGLIQSTFKGKIINAVNKNPKFNVVFIGPAVKLISTNQKGFSKEDKKHLEEVSKLITEMSKDGIKFEICLFAARLFKVDPKTVLPEIKHEENGAISLIGYQAKGYSLVPLY